jgi:hypothetical protein
MRRLQVVRDEMNALKTMVLNCTDELERIRIADKGLNLVSEFFRTPSESINLSLPEPKFCRYCQAVKVHFVKDRYICRDCWNAQQKFYKNNISIRLLK